MKSKKGGLMYQVNLSKKISFRCSSSTFNVLYHHYLKHKTYSQNITFSDFIRNCCLATVLSNDENETESIDNNI